MPTLDLTHFVLVVTEDCSLVAPGRHWIYTVDEFDTPLNFELFTAFFAFNFAFGMCNSASGEIHLHVPETGNVQYL